MIMILLRPDRRREMCCLARGARRQPDFAPCRGWSLLSGRLQRARGYGAANSSHNLKSIENLQLGFSRGLSAKKKSRNVMGGGPAGHLSQRSRSLPLCPSPWNLWTDPKKSRAAKVPTRSRLLEISSGWHEARTAPANSPDLQGQIRLPRKKKFRPCDRARPVPETNPDPRDPAIRSSHPDIATGRWEII